jgi:3-phosphoglycerate kinase
MKLSGTSERGGPRCCRTSIGTFAELIIGGGIANNFVKAMDARTGRALWKKI